MPRKLKVYCTSIGFFELAVAAPSMKAAAEAWGSVPDIFKRGFAKQTDEPNVVAAAMASPGVVLRRPVGSHANFSEHAALPKLPAGRRKVSAPRPEPPDHKKNSSAKLDDTATGEAAQRKEQKREALARKQEEAKRERVKKERDRMIATANTAFEEARTRHNGAIAALTQRRDALQRDEAREKERWIAEQLQHEDALNSQADPKR